MKIRFFVDMDGVLAKWENVSIEETHEAGYFASREADDDAIELVGELKKRSSEECDVEVKILTSTYEDDHSEAEKRNWVVAEKIPVPQEDIICVPYGKDKFEYVEEKEGILNVLIDDYGKNLKAWEDHGFFAVKYYNGINNQPKLSVNEDGSVSVTIDSWFGASVDNRMTGKAMAKRILALAKAEIS